MTTPSGKRTVKVLCDRTAHLGDLDAVVVVGVEQDVMRHVGFARDGLGMNVKHKG